MTGTELTEWMGAARLTQADLAQRLGTTRQRVWQLMREDVLPETWAAPIRLLQRQIAESDVIRAGRDFAGCAH